MSVTCVCDDPIESPSNSKCGAIDYGSQIVKVFFQKATGTDFNGAAGNTITVEADWDTRLAADDDDRIVVIGHLANGVMPATDPNVEEDNAVEYGGIEVIDQPREITADMKYLTSADLAILDYVNCWDFVRMWFLTNRNWVWGGNATTGAGIANVSVLTRGYQMEGIGTKNRKGLRVKWNELCDPKPIAQLAFLATKEGSNTSGSTL